MAVETVQNSTFSATAGGAITVIIIWAVQTWGNLPVPPEVSSAFTAITMALVTHLVPDSTSTRGR